VNYKVTAKNPLDKKTSQEGFCGNPLKAAGITTHFQVTATQSRGREMLPSGQRVGGNRIGLQTLGRKKGAEITEE